MRNLLIVVLLAAVGVLGYLYFRSKTRLAMLEHTPGKGGNPSTLRTPGTKHKRKDHNNKDVDTQECDTIINNDTCVIPLSTLRKMSQSSQDTYAFEVHHGDKIIWFGDKGESIDVQPLAGVACPNSSGPASQIYLLTTISPPGVLQMGQVTGDPSSTDPDHDQYCYKTTIKVQGEPKPVDPHIFDLGQ